MSEMGDWINQLMTSGVVEQVPLRDGRNGLPVGPAPAGFVPYAGHGYGPYGPEMAAPPGERVDGPAPVRPGNVAPTLPDIGTPPTAAGAGAGISPMARFLLMNNSMSPENGITQEMYDYFGGDEILQALQQYDPGYRWVDTMVGQGGEGASAGTPGKKLVGSTPGQFVLPSSASGIDMLNLRPANFGSQGLNRPDFIFHDPVYGDVTHSANIKEDSSGLHAWAPYIGALISMGGPALAGALAAGGVGLAGAGATSGVTGGAAGLGASNIAMGGQPGWWSQLASKVPQAGKMTAPYLHSPDPIPQRPPVVPKMSVPDPYGFNPGAFNNMGSAAKVGGGDSSLVANQFAADPYGFSRG